VASALLVARMLWDARSGPAARGTRVVQQRDLAVALAAWTAAAPADTLDLRLDGVPRSEERDWLHALARAGTSVRWSSRSSLPALALEAEPRTDPVGGVTARIAAPIGAQVQVRDAASLIASIVLTARGATITIPIASQPLFVRVGDSRAAVASRDSLLPRRVVVLARGGWEAKFVIAALEERGWLVDARLSVAPGIDVTQGAPGALDTARVAAVIALDSTADQDASRIAAFVRSGGGLVLEPEAAARPAFAALAAGGVAPRERPRTLAFADSAPRRALTLSAIAPLRVDAVAIERRDGRVAAAARRVGAGRVIQLAYDESWRWRMSGGDGAVEAHRRWWTQVVGAAAYRALGSTSIASVDDAAPLASLYTALGAPHSARDLPATNGRGGLRLWMILALGAMLLAEWGSRRLRGAS